MKFYIPINLIISGGSMNLKEEIEEFKIQVMNGMYMKDYISKSKNIKIKIEKESEKSLKFFSNLYFSNLITMEQYLNMKTKVDNSRMYYKSLLSFY